MRKILLIVIITSIFFLSNYNFSIAYEKEIQGISSTLAENITKAGKKMIAVVDFTDLQGNVTELGRFIAEEFSVTFAGAGKGFEVVDRTHLKSILTEHKLSASGIIDPQTARKLGQIAGVDALITGTITPFGDSVRLSVKILDTATAKVLGASSGDIAKTKAIEELLARGIETTQPLRQEPSVSYVPSPTIRPKSKKVGEITVTMMRITISKNQVIAVLDFFNQSDKEIKLARDEAHPSLTDEKGNIFVFREGPPFELDNLLPKPGHGLTLNPKSNNDIILMFYPKDRDFNIKEIGSDFALSFNFKFYNLKDNSISKHNLSFTDMKAQKPK